MRPSPRLRRLANDQKAMMALRADSSLFTFTSYGDPSEKFRVTFLGRGLALNPGGGVALSERHEVEIVLGADYPRIRPDLKWRSPIFHPNISESGLVCLGGYSTDWVPSLTIDRLCTMLWDMIRWANFDVRSPYNITAARWAKSQSDYAFPLDPRQIRNRVNPPTTAQAPPRPSNPPGIVFLDREDR